MFMSEVISKFIQRFPDGLSFSQSGEDRIVKFLFDVLKISKPIYLDIGAHHPCKLSNTYLFYLLGGHGVLIDPNPKWEGVIRRKRPQDIFLNVGLGGECRRSVPFYIMSSDTLCTFSGEEAERMVEECNERIIETRKIDILTPDMVLSKYFPDGLNYVSLDVEGLEMEILESFDFSLYRPEVFCIETLTYSKTGTGKKVPQVSSFLESKGYFLYADTYINSIFVAKEKWLS